MIGYTQIDGRVETVKVIRHGDDTCQVYVMRTDRLYEVRTAAIEWR